MTFLISYIQSLAGVTISAFEPKSPVPVPTPDALFKAAVATNSDIIFCVPTFIEVCKVWVYP